MSVVDNLQVAKAGIQKSSRRKPGTRKLNGLLDSGSSPE